MSEVHTEKEEESYIEKYVTREAEMRFHEFLQSHITNNDLTVADVMNNSRINKNYGYNIVNGTRTKPGRDKVIALCVGAGMDLNQMQRALYLAEHPQINPCNERDVRIAVAVNNGIKDVLKLNILLEGKGMPPLEI